MPQDGDEEPIGVARIHGDGRDHLAVAQPEMLPRAPGVSGLVHPVTDGQVGTDDTGASPHVDDAGVRRGDGDRADRAGRLVIEQRNPVGAEVGGSPETSVVEAGVEGIRLAGDASQRTGASGTSGADIAPAHLAEREVLGGGGRPACTHEGGSEGGESQKGAHAPGVCHGAAIWLVPHAHKKGYRVEFRGWRPWRPYYFHTDRETPDTVPWTGLQATTRAYAKIIDEVNKQPLRTFQRPEEPVPTR